MHKVLVAIFIASMLVGCGGQSDSGAPQGVPTVVVGDGGAAEESPEAYFAAYLGQQTGFCRTCHIPNGAADKPEGRRLLLSSDPADDYQRFYAAWQRFKSLAA